MISEPGRGQQFPLFPLSPENLLRVWHTVGAESGFKGLMVLWPLRSRDKAFTQLHAKQRKATCEVAQDWTSALGSPL
jgi:hypothetical protein